MNNIIFAKTRHFYQGYQDFYRLAELAGYPVVYLDEVDWQDARLTVIATPKHPEWDKFLAFQQHRCRLIWWNLERGHTNEPIMDMSNPFVPNYVDEVWTSDRAFAQNYNFKYVFLGGDQGFAGNLLSGDKQYDYISLMYWSGRRQAIRGALQNMTCGDLPEGGTWGDERNKRLIASRLMISAHQDDQRWCEPIRFLIAASYGLPLVSESCQDSGYWLPGVHYISAVLNEVPLKARLLLDNEVIRLRVAANAWHLVCQERPFRQEVEAAL